MKWVKNKTKSHYVKKGYKFTFYGDEFKIPVEDLTISSNMSVEVLCDYCNKKITKGYDKYRRSRDESPVKKDACSKCHPQKTKEGNKLLYGVEHYTQKSGEAEKIAVRKRLSYEYIKEEFKKRGLILLTLTYKNSAQLLEYTCTKHLDKGILKGSWTNIRNQIGCGYCGSEEGGKKQRKGYQEIQQLFKSKGLTLLTTEDEYLGTKNTVHYFCEKHPEYILENTADGIRYIKGCRRCFSDRNRGANCHTWKGGINTIKFFLRDQTKEWKKDSLKAWNYKCAITGKNAEVIHHLQSFAFLMDIVFKRLKLDIRPYLGDYTEKEQLSLAEMIKKIHYEYGYGVALTKEMHILFHKKFGWENNTPEQFEEFKQKKAGNR